MGVGAGAGVAVEVRGGVGLGVWICVGAGVGRALVPTTPTVGGAESHAASASAMRVRTSAGTNARFWKPSCLFIRRDFAKAKRAYILSIVTNLEHLSLSGNQLSGCIPGSLRDVRDNDLSNLGLPFCAH